MDKKYINIDMWLCFYISNHYKIKEFNEKKGESEILILFYTIEY